MRETTLHTLRPGECARITGLHVTDSLRRRLLDIGLTNGSLVECVGRSPFGDPCAYQIRGAVIAIRHADSQNITVNALWD